MSLVSDSLTSQAAFSAYLDQLETHWASIRPSSPEEARKVCSRDLLDAHVAERAREEYLADHMTEWTSTLNRSGINGSLAAAVLWYGPWNGRNFDPATAKEFDDNLKTHLADRYDDAIKVTEELKKRGALVVGGKGTIRWNEKAAQPFFSMIEQIKSLHKEGY